MEAKRKKSLKAKHGLKDERAVLIDKVLSSGHSRTAHSVYFL